VFERACRVSMDAFPTQEGCLPFYSAREGLITLWYS
jgi:hypothetical protein